MEIAQLPALFVFIIGFAIAFSAAPAYSESGGAACGPGGAGWNHMVGFRKDKLQSQDRAVRYVIGRILCQSLPSAENLKAALPEIQKSVPGVVQLSKDKLHVPDEGDIDVIRAMGSPAQVWQWHYTGRFSGVAPASILGWDMKKFADPDYHSAKYDIGRILFAHSPGDGNYVAALNKALPDIQKFELNNSRPYANTVIVDSDKLQIPGTGAVDVIKNAEGEGSRW